MRNIHLAVWGVFVAFGGMASQPGDVALVRANGFFGGYNTVVWSLVAVQVCLGEGESVQIKIEKTIWI